MVMWLFRNKISIHLRARLAMKKARLLRRAFLVFYFTLSRLPGAA
jgi:hypothetical protein